MRASAGGEKIQEVLHRVGSPVQQGEPMSSEGAGTITGEVGGEAGHKRGWLIHHTWACFFFYIKIYLNG